MTPRITLAVAFMFLCTASGATATEPPATLSVDDRSKPFWISAHAATTSPDEMNTQPCPSFTVAPDRGGRVPSSTWRDALQNAPAIYAGSVVENTSGFSNGVPVSLLTVKIDKVLRASARYPVNGSIFVIYYGADFHVGTSRFCNGGLRRNGVAFLPATHDQVLIFAFSPPLNEQPYLSVGDENLVFGRAGVTYLPFDFERDPERPKGPFEALIQEAANH